MAKFVMDNKIFDTETAEKLCKWSKQWKTYNYWLRGYLYPFRDTTLYRTKLGNYFCVGGGDFGSLTAQLMTEDEAKDVLILHNYNKYVEIYGELEEG